MATNYGACSYCYSRKLTYSNIVQKYFCWKCEKYSDTSVKRGQVKAKRGVFL